MKIIFTISSLLILSSSLAAELTGRELYYKECVKCHRKEGKNGGIISDVAGKDEQYLINQLHLFKSGQRHPAIFAPIKERLTNSEIKKLAKFMQHMGNKR